MQAVMAFPGRCGACGDPVPDAEAGVWFSRPRCSGDPWEECCSAGCGYALHSNRGADYAHVTAQALRDLAIVQQESQCLA